MEVLKVKLNLKAQTLEADYKTDAGDEITFKGVAQVHPDLEKALAKLNDHLGDICEMEDITSVIATGFTIGGEGDHQGAVVIGRKLLANNRILNLCSPFVKFDPDLEPYEGAASLARAIRGVQVEAVEYLEGRKIGGATQGDLFPDLEVVGVTALTVE